MFWFCLFKARNAIMLAVTPSTTISCSLGRQYEPGFSPSFRNKILINQITHSYKMPFTVIQFNKLLSFSLQNFTSRCHQLLASTISYGSRNLNQKCIPTTDSLSGRVRHSSSGDRRVPWLRKSSMTRTRQHDKRTNDFN